MNKCQIQKTACEKTEGKRTRTWYKMNECLEICLEVLSGRELCPLVPGSRLGRLDTSGSSWPSPTRCHSEMTQDEGNAFKGFYYLFTVSTSLSMSTWLDEELSKSHWSLGLVFPNLRGTKG